jgi:hypothetical protein
MSENPPEFQKMYDGIRMNQALLRRASRLIDANTTMETAKREAAKLIAAELARGVKIEDLP